jgi:ABC-type glycerol-3-phosphate transport system substrate-binding protein
MNKSKSVTKLIAVILILALSFTMLIGCNKATESSNVEEASGVTETPGETDSSSAQTPSTELKTIRILGVDCSAIDSTGNKVYLSDWVNGDSKMWDRLTSDLAEMGIQLELDLIPDDQYETVIQTQIAAGLDCDLVNINGVDLGTRMSLINEGKIVPINEIWDNNSDGTAKDYYNNGYGTVISSRNVMEDGNAYWISPVTIGKYNEKEWGGFIGPMIRKDWLDQLGLPVPKTTDELFETLKAFYEQDANGNGEKDEVAIIDYEKFSNGIAQLFGLGWETVYVDYTTGVATTPWYHENVKNYIQYMNQLYNAGLLDISGQGNEKKAENKVSLINDWWVETWVEPGIITPEGAPKPYLLGFLSEAVQGTKPVLSRQGAIQKGGVDFAVTKQADKEAIGKLLDYITSEKYSTLSEFGIEGYTYQVLENGKLSKLPANGIPEVDIMSTVPALWVNNSILPRFEITDRAQELISCKEAGYSMGYPETGFADKAAAIENVYMNGDAYAYTYLGTEAEIAVATEEEIDTISDIQIDIDTYCTELLSKLIIGDESLEDWDSYIEDMKGLGLDKMIEITQTRFDRANK